MCSIRKMHNISRDFIDWASRYDTAGLEQLSLATHNKWLDELPKHINLIRLEGSFSEKELVNLSLKAIQHSQYKPMQQDP